MLLIAFSVRIETLHFSHNRKVELGIEKVDDATSGKKKDENPAKKKNGLESQGSVMRLARYLYVWSTTNAFTQIAACAMK